MYIFLFLFLNSTLQNFHSTKIKNIQNTITNLYFNDDTLKAPIEKHKKKYKIKLVFLVCQSYIYGIHGNSILFLYIFIKNLKI